MEQITHERTGHLRENCRRCRRLVTGFTLLELMIAISISTVVSVVLYTFFGYVLTAKDGGDLFSSDLARFQRAMIIIARDVEQTIQRPVRNSFGDVEPPLVVEGGESFRLTHVGWTIPPFPRSVRSEVQRVSYSIVDQSLVRKHWLTPDITADSSERNPIETTLFEKIEGFEVRVAQRGLNGSPEWYTEWPPELGQKVDEAGNPIKADPLPQWLEFRFDHPRFGEQRRIFRLVENGADPKVLPPPKPTPAENDEAGKQPVSNNPENNNDQTDVPNTTSPNTTTPDTATPEVGVGEPDEVPGDEGIPEDDVQ